MARIGNPERRIEVVPIIEPLPQRHEEPKRVTEPEKTPEKTPEKITEKEDA